MEDPFHYRNKAQFPFGKNRDGKIITGFYAGRTHSIIENTSCHLGKEVNEEILEKILAWMNAFHVEPYNEATGKGLMRHSLIRCGFPYRRDRWSVSSSTAGKSRERRLLWIL